MERLALAALLLIAVLVWAVGKLFEGYVDYWDNHDDDYWGD